MLDKSTIQRLVTQSFDCWENLYLDNKDEFHKFARAIEAAVREEMAKQEPVAVVDASDDGQFAEILPDRSVKVGQFLYAAPVVPDGMVMVPREPSDQMIHAAKRNGAEGSDEEIASDYRAMIAEAEKQK